MGIDWRSVMFSLLRHLKPNCYTISFDGGRQLFSKILYHTSARIARDDLYKLVRKLVSCQDKPT